MGPESSLCSVSRAARRGRYYVRHMLGVETAPFEPHHPVLLPPLLPRHPSLVPNTMTKSTIFLSASLARDKSRMGGIKGFVICAVVTSSRYTRTLQRELEQRAVDFNVPYYF